MMSRMLPFADVRPPILFLVWGGGGGLRAAVLCSGEKPDRNVPHRMLQWLELRRAIFI